MDEAEEKFRQAISIDPNDGNAYYNWACLEGLRGNTETCLEYLGKSYKAGKLPTLAHIDADIDLDSVRETPEFKAFLEKVLKERGK